MASGVLDLLSQLPPWLVVLMVAALPVIELRGAIPVAMAMGFSPLEAFGLGIVGNLLPVPLILWLLGPIRNLLARRGPFKPFFDWLEQRALRRRGLVDRYGVVGLMAFVGLPLPGTGAWTGALLAVILGIPFRRSLPAIALGVFCAAVIIGLLSTAGFMALR